MPEPCFRCWKNIERTGLGDQTQVAVRHLALLQPLKGFVVCGFSPAGGTIRTLSSHLLGSDLGLQAWRPDLARHCQSQNAVTYAVLSKTILSGTNEWSEFRFHSIKMNKPRLTWMDRMHMIPFINHVDSIWKEVLFQLKDAWYKRFAKDQANNFHPQEKSEVLIQELRPF